VRAMTRMANEYERADHDRDNRKHDPRPGDLDKRILHVAYLTAYLDTLLRLNRIPDDLRDGVRRSVDNTRKAFNLPELHHAGSVDA
jgi:hypothetical protein